MKEGISTASSSSSSSSSWHELRFTLLGTLGDQARGYDQTRIVGTCPGGEVCVIQLSLEHGSLQKASHVILVSFACTVNSYRAQV